MRRSAAPDTPGTGPSPSPVGPEGSWRGRVDGDGPEHARWHQRVRSATDSPAVLTDVRGSRGPGPAPTAGGARQTEAGFQVSVLGFRSDEGVRRNRGRIGSADGPAALRGALAPLALHERISILDHGDAATAGEDLEAGQSEAAALITGALDDPGTDLTVVLGGGHETAWASYRGLMASRAVADHGPRWGVLNLDAHFDLREEERPTSGTPFAQIAAAEREAGRALDYAVLGIAESSNTAVLFERARALGVRWMTDLECAEAGAVGVRSFVEDFAHDLDVLYLTIDLDVLPAAVAPGVSAPAGLGVETALVAAAVRAAAATGTLALLDVVELNPALDIDGRTARTAARLVDLAVHRAVALR